MQSMENLSDVWEALLSENPGLIRRAWGDLTVDEARTVIAHLRKMVEGEAYGDVQRHAAQVALETIREAG